MTSRHDDDDPVADSDQDTRPAEMMAPPAQPPRSPVPMPAQSARDALANGGPAAGDAGKYGPVGAGTEAAATEYVPPVSSGTNGPARDSILSFSKPAPAPASPASAPNAAPGTPAPAADDWMPHNPGGSPPGDPPAADAPSRTGTDTGTRNDSAVSWAASATEPSASGLPSATEPSAPESAPPVVSAAAFSWGTPEPAPPPSSPAQNFLHSSANAATPAAPAAAATAAATVADQVGNPARGMPLKRSAKRTARQAHLTVARVEPWSVMKFSFVVSLVAFVILFVAVSVLYSSLSALGVFESLQRVVTSVTSSQDSTGVNAAKWFTASRVLGYTALLGSLNIVLITAMCTIGAVVYNLTSRLVGGVEVTLRETE